MIFYQLDIHRRQFNDAGYYEFAPVGKRRFGEFPLCPACRCKIGILPWLPPYTVKITGKTAGDIIAGSGRSFLVSNALLEAVRSAGLADFEVLEHFNIANSGRRKAEIDGNFAHIHPRTVVTKMDELATRFEIHKLVGCDVCRVAQRTRIEGFRVEESSWTGDHFFYPSGLYGCLLVTEPVANVLRSASFKNIHLVHQDDYREHWQR